VKGRNLLIAIAVVLSVAGAAQAQTNMDCSCSGVAAQPSAGCGNGGIGAAQGDIFVNVPPADVQQFFGPNTGWTCVVPSAVWSSGGPLGCYCANYCGNGGIGADPKTFSLGLTQDTINKNYGGGKSGNKTGWLCGNYRGNWADAKATAKVKK